MKNNFVFIEKNCVLFSFSSFGFHTIDFFLDFIHIFIDDNKKNDQGYRKNTPKRNAPPRIKGNKIYRETGTRQC